MRPDHLWWKANLYGSVSLSSHWNRPSWQWETKWRSSLSGVRRQSDVSCCHLTANVMIRVSLKAVWYLHDPSAVAAPWKYQVLAQMTAASKLLQHVPEDCSAVHRSAAGATERCAWVVLWVSVWEQRAGPSRVIRQIYKLNSLTCGSSRQPNTFSIKHLEWDSFLWVFMTQATSDKRKFTLCELKVISVPISTSCTSLSLPFCTPGWLHVKGFQCWAKLPCFHFFFAVNLVFPFLFSLHLSQGQTMPCMQKHSISQPLVSRTQHLFPFLPSQARLQDRGPRGCGHKHGVQCPLRPTIVLIHQHRAESYDRRPKIDLSLSRITAWN